MIKSLFNKKETKLIILSTLVLSFAFGFNDKRPDFVLSYWLLNMLQIIILVTISLLIIEITTRILAKKYACTIEYQIWGIKRFFLGRILGFYVDIILKRKIPLGIILSILGAFISKGSFVFALVQNHEVKENRALRAFRKNPHITELETAIIYSVAPLIAVFLICLAKILNISALATINSYFAIFLILPFPSSNAIKFLFSAKFFYLFIFIFVILSTILLAYTGIISSIIIAILSATIILILSLFKTYK